MTITDLAAPWTLSPPTSLWPGQASSSVTVIDDNNSGVGLVFNGNGKTISDIGFNVSAISGTGGTLTITLEGRTGSGNPGAITHDTVVKSTWSTGWLWSPLNTNYATSFDESLSAMVRGIGVDGTNNITVRHGTARHHNQNGWPYATVLNTGSWARAGTLAPHLAVRYTDGSVTPYVFPSTGVVNQDWDSGGSPLYRGGVWTVPGRMRISGMGSVVRSSGDYEVFLLKNDVALPISTTKTDIVDLANSSQWAIYARLFEPEEFVAGDKVRLMFEPQTTTNINFFPTFPAPDAASLAVMGDVAFSTATSLGGPYTDFDNGTDGYTWVPMAPTIDGIEFDGGGGGGTPIFGPRAWRVA